MTSDTVNPTELAEGITAGLKTEPYRPKVQDARRLRDESGALLAEVLVQKRAVRVNLKHALPKTAPAELRRAVTDCRSGWSQALVVTEESAVPLARKLLAFVIEQPVAKKTS
jgi:hypothetical protein